MQRNISLNKKGDLPRRTNADILSVNSEGLESPNTFSTLAVSSLSLRQNVSYLSIWHIFCWWGMG